MSEAFGSTVEAADHGDAAREEERLQSHDANIDASGRVYKREVGKAAMRSMHSRRYCTCVACFRAMLLSNRQAVRPASPEMLPNRFAQKRGSIRRWSLMTGPKSKSEVGGKWTREEERHLPGGYRSREEDTTSTRMSQTGTEGGGNGAGHIDILNMDSGTFVSNAATDRSAMR